MKVIKKNAIIKGVIDLTPSKSESNRALLIQALSKEKLTINNLASAKDTQTFIELVNSDKITWDVGPAGTTFRFLTAYSAIQPNQVRILTGSQRMLERPIHVLVDALRQLGADIVYLGEEGYPPIQIKGKALRGGEVSMRGDVSSQFISAMCMIGPCLDEGLTIHFITPPTSVPYINMTLKMMQHFGADVQWQGESIVVKAKPYQGGDFTIESDWSAASYWYELAALSEEVDLTIHGLKKESLQADAQTAILFDELGVETQFVNNGVQLRKKAISAVKDVVDFTDCPDIAQTLAATYAALGLEKRLTGLHSLRIKETDRIAALKEELNGLGYEIVVEGDDLIVRAADNSGSREYEVKTYHDHRMAMAFAPLALKRGAVLIQDPEVVVKSYPEYWDHLQQVGFELED